MTTTPSLLENELEALLNEPIERAKQRACSAFDERLSRYGRKVVLFGAGNMGRQVLERLRRDGIEPLAFSDNCRTNWGKLVDGIPLLSPAEAAARYGREALFIVTIYNHDHSFPDTRRQLTQLGCIGIVSVIPLRWKYHDSFLPYYRDDLPHKVLEQANAVREGFRLWADEVSRREYVAQVNWRLHGDFDVLGPLSRKPYFPEDEIFRLAPGEFFVDVGAYDGDTLSSFLALRANDFSRVMAFEPDPITFEKLDAYVQTLPETLRSRIETKPLAVSAHPGQLRFASGQGTSSKLSNQGSVEVQCCRLDDVLGSQVPTYIKMDIEGAELDAINGARQTVKQKQPLLAVCVYHVQDHLWKVPLAIHEANPDYRYFLRPYMPECWETVCYAVPQSRFQRERF